VAQSAVDEPFAWGADWNAGYDGRSSSALVNAGAGNDTIAILAGASGVIDGGAGTDTVSFGAAPTARFTVQALADGSTQVQDTTGAVGTFVLWGVEQLSFGDGAMAAPGQAAYPGAPIAIGAIGSTPDTPLPPGPVTPPPTDTGGGTGTPPPTDTGGGTGGGTVDWNALAAAVTAYYEATGQWYGGDPADLLNGGGGDAGGSGGTPTPTPDPTPEPSQPVDWNAIAAQVMANFAETGVWYA
jgi:hypothetical protein